MITNNIYLWGLRNNGSDDLYVKPSGIAGKGLHAHTNIPKDTVLCYLHGQIVEHDYDNDFWMQYPNWVGVGYQKYLVMEESNHAIFTNHSCAPNAYINAYRQLVTLRAISADEEILIDYATTELDDQWHMHCFCGADCCRKIIRSFQYLDGQKKAFYKDKIPEDFYRYAEVQPEVAAAALTENLS